MELSKLSWLHSAEPLDAENEQELLARTIPSDVLPLILLMNTVQGYEKCIGVYRFFISHVLLKLTEVRKLKVSCHALLPPETHTTSAEVGSAHTLFLLLQLCKQLRVLQKPLFLHF